MQAEIDRQTLEEEPFLVNKVAWLGGRTFREEALELRPGDLRLAAVAGEDGARIGDFSPKVGIAGNRQTIQDTERIVPLPVEDEAIEPRQPGGYARTDGTAGSTQRYLRL